MTKEKQDDDMLVTLTVGELRALVREEITLAMTGARPAPVPGRWVDIPAAAEKFGCTQQTVRNWIKRGAPAMQIGTASHPTYRINLEEFHAWATRAKPNTKIKNR